MEICGPTLTYGILAVIATYYVHKKKRDIITNIYNAIFHAIWLTIIRFTCRIGYRGIAWGLVALPVVLLLILTLYVARLLLKMFRNFKTDTKGCGDKGGPDKGEPDKGEPVKGKLLSRSKKVLSKIDEYFKAYKHV
jgi:hypothetical protein